MSGVGAPIVSAFSFALLRALAEAARTLPVSCSANALVDDRISGGVEPSNKATVSGSVVSNISCLL